MIDLYIPYQMNDQYGEGSVVNIPEHTSNGAPVAAVIRLFLRICPTEGPAFQGYHKKAWVHKHRPLSASAWNKELRAALRVCCPDINLKRISSHSLRKGGFSAAKAAGMSHECALRIIGHKSMTAWMRYAYVSESQARAQSSRIHI